jgi:hypothetical protein
MRFEVFKAVTIMIMFIFIINIFLICCERNKSYHLCNLLHVTAYTVSRNTIPCIIVKVFVYAQAYVVCYVCIPYMHA